MERRRDSGMTLIELMLALCILGLVSGGVSRLISAHLEQYRFQQARADALENGRVVLATMVRELAGAQYGVLGAVPSCHESPSFQIDEEVPSSLRFLSNINAVASRLSRPANPGDAELSIPDDRWIQNEGRSLSPGRDFKYNDTIYVYDVARAGDPPGIPSVRRVACFRLASDGISGRIRLAQGDFIRNPFPAGSPVQVVNQVSYDLDRQTGRLMRRMDGGSEVLADGVREIRFRILGDRVLIRLVLGPMRGSPDETTQTFETSVTLRNR